MKYLPEDVRRKQNNRSQPQNFCCTTMPLFVSYKPDTVKLLRSDETTATVLMRKPFQATT